MHFKTMDLITDLREICFSNTKNYRSDFEVDAKIIMEEALKETSKRNHLLWMSYPDGTHCFPEGDVFLKDSPAHCTWLYYNSQMSESKKIACAIEIEDIADGKVRGIIYQLDYMEHCSRVEANSVPASRIRCIFEKGTEERSAYKSFSYQSHDSFGELKTVQWIPDDADRYNKVLLDEKRIRSKMSVHSNEVRL